MIPPPVFNQNAAYGWGNNHKGRLGDGTPESRLAPVQAYGMATSVQRVAAGGSHSLVILSDGSLWSYGYNNHGQLGDGSTADHYVPVRVAGLSGVTQVAGGDMHTLALRSDGTVWAWGYNGTGQLGDGTTTDRTRPVRVAGLNGVTHIAAGDFFSLAVRSDGTAVGLGEQRSGPTRRRYPQQPAEPGTRHRPDRHQAGCRRAVVQPCAG